MLVRFREVDALRTESDSTRQMMDDVYDELRKKGFSVKLDIEATDDPLKMHEQLRLRLRSLDMPELVEQLHAKIRELEATRRSTHAAKGERNERSAR